MGRLGPGYLLRRCGSSAGLVFRAAVVIASLLAGCSPLRASSRSNHHRHLVHHASKAATNEHLRGNSSFDPYKVSRATLKRCHIRTFPLEAIKKLPDRGKEYIYDIEGAKTIYKVPPVSFDPLKANDRQLRKYGLPLRPNGGAKLWRWKRMMKTVHFSKPPPYLVEGKATAPGPSFGKVGTR